ncbi:MAG: hypothetical protein HN742_12640 [Lentisphaerae bacterium]|jgi:hypothetical protein|nr:hypothetical protein [Lentisphaerota bacterium]MBT4816874.1 hypothetical protein [Lentisphaerota bacterium]MBT5607126.1 hypothetical protein [Lentisphaerota bacterium]MBT7053528.1 hypothetical protein [Lentisphaerota bacterium]MBT7842716.1 hypothetical protein [Lentisphaerota bacterium]
MASCDNACSEVTELHTFPGLRLPADALVNFSPDLLKEIATPILERYGRAFGELCIHYCSKPAPSAHVLTALGDCSCLRAVDTWQGPDAFCGDEAPGRMQDRVALIFDADFRTEEAMTALLQWEPIRDVPRKGGARPRVAHVSPISRGRASNL